MNDHHQPTIETEYQDVLGDAEGKRLTADILALAAPLVDGKPSKLVVQVMGGVMLSTVLLAGKDVEQRRALLREMATVLGQIADWPWQRLT
jgi:hypothetical protein